jgi:cyclic pyranopterin phosphate synthase
MNADYLRVSVTDRCNLRCIYCHPLDGCDFVERKEILRLEEIYHIVQLFVECGIRKVRLTGGEPLVRKNIVYLVEKLAGIEGIEELALTTNGVLLESLAAELKDAGLHQVNISMDSTDSEIYKQITGFDLLPTVTKGIYKALEVGLRPVKINTVIMRSINVSQIPLLAQMSVRLPVTVRFIEYCPTSKYAKPASDYVPTSKVREIIEFEFGHLLPVIADGTSGPASYFKIKNSTGTIGFISGRSSILCQSCNRLRLTSEGKIVPCLYSSHHYDIKKLIRAGAGDEEVMKLLKKILQEKSNHTKLNSSVRDIPMQKIGG